MSAQRLNEKKTRMLAEKTGLPVIRAWAHGGYIYDFVTQGHLHGWYSIKSGEWGIIEGHILHYTTCPDHSQDTPEPMFPNGVPPLTEAEQAIVRALR